MLHKAKARLTQWYSADALVWREDGRQMMPHSWCPDGNSFPELSPFHFELKASLCIICRVFRPLKASQEYKSKCSKRSQKKLQVSRTFYLPHSVSQQVRIQAPIQEKGRNRLYFLMEKWCTCLRKKQDSMAVLLETCYHSQLLVTAITL